MVDILRLARQKKFHLSRRLFNGKSFGAGQFEQLGQPQQSDLQIGFCLYDKF